MNSPLPTANSQGETTKRAKVMKKTLMFVFLVSVVVHPTAQQLLDRVVARVGSLPLTQTDVDFAVAFGVVDPKQGDPVKQMIERRLVIVEVNRFPPPEPSEMAISELAAKMKAAAGAQAAAVMAKTGVDDKRLSEFARETLRIDAYMAQRFGSGPRSQQQRTQWLDGLRARGDISEFTTR